MQFNKLVRDKIPEKIRRNGELIGMESLIPAVSRPIVRSEFFNGREVKIFFAETNEDLNRALKGDVDFVANARLFGAIFTAPSLDVSVEVFIHLELVDVAFFVEGQNVQWFYIETVTKREFLDRLGAVFGKIKEVYL